MTPDQALALTWADFDHDMHRLADAIRAQVGWREASRSLLVGQPRGGLIVAVAVAHHLGVVDVTVPERACAVPALRTAIWIDDILDSGRTIDLVVPALKECYPQVHTAVWVNRRGALGVDAVARPLHNDRRWVVFPWERPEHATADRAAYHQARR